MAKRSKPQDEGDDTVEALDELLSVAPEEFVAARNAKVKELKAAGHRDQAALVAALRRPTAVDWALNTVASEHADDVDRFVRAAEAGRAAQAAAAEGRPGEDLRGALDELRDATAEVTRRAEHVLARTGTSASTQPAAITSRLVAVAANPGLSEQLERRSLGFAAAGEAGDDLFAGLTAGAGGPAAPAPASTKRAPEPRRREKPEPDQPPGISAAEQRKRRQALATAERIHKQAETAQTRAATRVRAAERDVTSAEQRVAAAETSRREAQASLAEATEEHDRAVAALDEAARARDAAQEAVDQADGAD